MDYTAWDQLYRTKSLIDTEIEGKNVVLRIDLDVPISDIEPADELSQQNLSAKEGGNTTKGETKNTNKISGFTPSQLNSGT